MKLTALIATRITNTVRNWPIEGGKVIKPLSPNANPARFTDEAKVDKWFKRNCNDVLGRECTTQEKADVLAWLMTVK